MKTYGIIKRSLFYLFFLSNFLIISDSFSSTTLNRTSLNSDQWVLHSEVSSVKIYYQISACEGKNVVYLKFDNTNKRAVRITWKEVFSTKQVPEEKEGYLGEKELTLAPGITSQNNCQQIQFKQCVVLPHQVQSTYIADIIKFDIKDISVILSS